MSRHQQLLEAHDADLRGEAEVADAQDITRLGPLWLGRYGSSGFISYTDLDGLRGAGLAGLVTAAVELFTAAGVARFEWKTRGHDPVPELPHLLAAAGFEPEPTETVMIGEAALLGPVIVPAGLTIRQAGATGDLAGDVERTGRLHAEVFGPQPPDREAELLRMLTAAGAGQQLWLALSGEEVVSTGRLARVQNSRFAGLFGGATSVAWRGRGSYRALTAARARAALALGASLVYAECTEFSRPILARSGLVAVTTTTPWLWRKRSR